MHAVEHAHSILNWKDNLPPDDVPPRWMWHLDHELEPWFQRVEDDRADRAGGDGREAREHVPMTQNEMTRGLRSR